MGYGILFRVWYGDLWENIPINMPGSTRFALGLVFDCLGCSMHALPRCYIINQSINGNNRTIFRLRVAFIRWLLTRNSFSKFLVCFQWNESRLILRAMNSGIKFFLLPYLWCGIYGLWAAKNIYGMGSSGAQTLYYGLWDDYGKNDYGAALLCSNVNHVLYKPCNAVVLVSLLYQSVTTG